MKRLSLIIPIYNSSKILPKTFAQLVNFFSSKEYLAEIIFVDDGSRDDSVETLARLMSSHAVNFNIKIIQHKENIGKGSAIKDGIFSVSDDSDYIFFTDDDLPFGLDVLEQMFFQLSDNEALDMVVGDRTLIKQVNDYPLFRKIGSFFFSLLLPGRITEKFPDTQCGLKGFKSSVAKQVFPLVVNSRWSFDVEVFLVVTQNSLSISKFPLMILEHAQASNFNVDEFPSILKEIFQLWVNSLKGRYRLL